MTKRFQQEIREAERSFAEDYPRVLASDARERMYRFTQCFIPYYGPLPDERLPLVYRPLVEFVLGLDWVYMVRPNQDRVLMRRALVDILPDEVRTGHGQIAFTAALLDGLRTAWPRVSAYLTGECLGDMGVVDPRRFRVALERMRSGYLGPNKKIGLTALYLETWLALKVRAATMHRISVGTYDTPALMSVAGAGTASVEVRSS